MFLISTFFSFFGFQLRFCHIHRFYPHRSSKQQLVTLQIRLHVEYLIQTYNILVLIFTQNWWQMVSYTKRNLRTQLWSIFTI